MIARPSRLLAIVMTMTILCISSVPFSVQATPDRGGAEPAIVVEAAPDASLPASRAIEIRAALERALAGRCPSGASVRLTIGQHDTDIEVSGLHRRVPVMLGRAGGTDTGSGTPASPDGDGEGALRLVALHALDLLQPGPDLGEVTPPPTATAAVATPAKIAAVPAVTTEEARRWSIMAGAALHAGPGATEPRTAGAALGAGMAWRALRTSLEVAWDHAGPSHPASVTAARYDAFSARLRGGAAFGPAELGLRAGAVVYRIDSASEVTSATPAVGPFAALRLRIAGRTSAWLEAGADFYTHRSTLSLGSRMVFSTPRLAPFAALGVVVEVAP